MGSMRTYSSSALLSCLIAILQLNFMLAQLETHIIHMDLSAMPKAFSSHHSWYATTVSNSIGRGEQVGDTNSHELLPPTPSHIMRNRWMYEMYHVDQYDVMGYRRRCAVSSLFDLNKVRTIRKGIAMEYQRKIIRDKMAMESNSAPPHPPNPGCPDHHHRVVAPVNESYPSQAAGDALEVVVVPERCSLRSPCTFLTGSAPKP
ncbi:hypothetical protein Scep_014701 [Stephania cephalantha]|uniref:Uncharacterized protein n=1 Tax=Stephania cephalantha TaxID=152367 RepID=A0AAP0J2H4_9MAGN